LLKTKAVTSTAEFQIKSETKAVTSTAEFR